MFSVYQWLKQFLFFSFMLLISECLCFSLFFLDVLFTTKESPSCQATVQIMDFCRPQGERPGKAKTVVSAYFGCFESSSKGVFQLSNPRSTAGMFHDPVTLPSSRSQPRPTLRQIPEKLAFVYTSWLTQNSSQNIDRGKLNEPLRPKFSLIHKQWLNIEQVYPFEANKVSRICS